MPGKEQELTRLPPGRHGLSREQVSRHQRERLIAGLAAAAAERGYAAATITDITKAASVSRRTFYEHFQSKEECYLAAFDVLVEYLRGLIAAAIAPLAGWSEKVIAGLGALLGFFAEEADLARLIMVESLGAGPAVTERFQTAVREFVPALRQGRAERSEGRELPETTETAVIGAVTSMVSHSIAVGEAARLRELLPDLVEFTLRPYLGRDEAQRLARGSA